MRNSVGFETVKQVAVHSNQATVEMNMPDQKELELQGLAFEFDLVEEAVQ